MFGTFFLISLGVMLLYKFLVSINKINKGDINWARVGRYAGVAGIIVICEALAPSFVLTGLKTPAPTNPARHMDSVPMTETGLTFEEFAARAPWAWRLGNVSRSDMERRIDTDISLATGMLEASRALEETLPHASIYRGAYGDKVPRLTALIEGLQAARTDLDTLFVTPQQLDAPLQTVASADAFIYTHIRNVLDVRRAETTAVRTAATDAVVAYQALKGEGLDTQAPEYLALLNTQTESFLIWSNEFGAISDLDMTRNAIARTDRSSAVDGIVPRFRRPVQVFQTRRLVQAPVTPVTAPAVPLTAVRALRKLRDAVTGYARTSPNVIEEHRCAIAIVDTAGVPTPEKICETAVRVPVNYDLTASSCGEGVAPEGCRESWIFPHLNIVYRQDSFTVYAPRPVDGAARISVWTVSWAGEEQPLTPSATFPWDGVTNVFGGLTLRHDVGAGVIKPMIWDDMRHVRADAGAGDGQDFTPVPLSGLRMLSESETAPQFFALGADDAETIAEAYWRLPNLRRSFVYHQNLLSMTARDVRKPDAANSTTSGLVDDAAPCNYFRFGGAGDVDSDISASLRDIVDVANGQVCDAVFGYDTLLETLERSTHGGSWLWMFRLSQ